MRTTFPMAFLLCDKLRLRRQTFGYCASRPPCNLMQLYGMTFSTKISSENFLSNKAHSSLWQNMWMMLYISSSWSVVVSN